MIEFGQLPVMEDAVKDIMPDVEAHRLVGETSHPATPMVDPAKISVYFPEITLKEDGRLIGIARPVSNANGDILKGLLNDGIKVGQKMSTMGLVNLKESIIKNVQSLKESIEKKDSDKKDW